MGQKLMLILMILLANTVSDSIVMIQDVQKALNIIYDVSTGNLGSLCSPTETYRVAPIHLQTDHFRATREKIDMAGLLIKEMGLNHHNGLADALTRSLVVSDDNILVARLMALNTSTGSVLNGVIWRRPTAPTDIPGPVKTGNENEFKMVRLTPVQPAPWLMIIENITTDDSGSWTYPYFSCDESRWLISYSVPIPPVGRHPIKGVLSVDVDVSDMDVNQCGTKYSDMEIDALRGSHKCHNDTTECVRTVAARGWFRGSYQCHCRPGYFSIQRHGFFNGSLVEAAWTDKMENISQLYDEIFTCRKCAPGCDTCQDISPCLAYYNWPFRITLLVVSLSCVGFSLCLICFVFKHRRLKVFKVASPIFLAITLCGCSIMYLEMVAIFPVLDTYSCIATKWNRHLGFCITYTALLMKTWRVSLTYRVKSAHKVKLTDKQLLQWMFPILLVMLIYLGAWTFSDPPTAEIIHDADGLKFKQCSFNWWDHSLAIGEVLFLAWGIKVCYNVRNAESFYNEAHLISYAIYNIAIVNIAMVAFHVFLFPRVGPDIKYLLGFIRTQLSTSVTIALVFGPKVTRVLRGQGDQWDNRARARGVTASFSLNGIGLVAEETADLFHENEELKEEIQKLAAQIEFMRIVHMETNNRHLRPRPGSYFQTMSAQVAMLQSPVARTAGLFQKLPTGADGSMTTSTIPNDANEYV